jgi:hypothetical protein
MKYRCIACHRPMDTPAATLERGGRVGYFGPKCAAKAGIPALPPEHKPSKAGRVRSRKSKPEGAQMALELEVGEVV